MNIADLTKGAIDPWGNRIEAFYALQPPEYAVYQTPERVTVQYADDVAKADAQRKALVQLAPVRGEINGLLQGWRDAKDKSKVLWFFSISNGARLRERAERYDRRMGDALVVGLEGDLTGAGDVMKAIKADILDVRTGWARLEYIVCSGLAAIGLIVLANLLSWPALHETHRVIVYNVWKRSERLLNVQYCYDGETALCFARASDLWRGAMAGPLGAFFSIALGIRGRTVLPDLNHTSNLLDAFLRVVIGTIAGVVLVALIDDGFVVIHIGDSALGQADSLYIAIAGFLAGFSERMVPDLLASAAAKSGEAPIVRAPIQQRPVGDAGQDQPKATDSQTIVGKSPAPDDAGAVAAGTDIVPEQAGEDCCSTAFPLAVDDVTADEDLPAASGGVDQVAQT